MSQIYSDSTIKWNIHLWAVCICVLEQYAAVCVVLRFYTGNLICRSVIVL